MYNSELNNLFILSASCFFSYYSWEFIQALLYSLLEIDTNEYFCFYLLETRSSFTAGYGIDTTWVFLVDVLKRDRDSPPPPMVRASVSQGGPAGATVSQKGEAGEYAPEDLFGNSLPPEASLVLALMLFQRLLKMELFWQAFINFNAF